jgi:hypothetical protein
MFDASMISELTEDVPISCSLPAAVSVSGLVPILDIVFHTPAILSALISDDVSVPSLSTVPWVTIPADVLLSEAGISDAVVKISVIVADVVCTFVAPLTMELTSAPEGTSAPVVASVSNPVPEIRVTTELEDVLILGDEAVLIVEEILDTELSLRIESMLKVEFVLLEAMLVVKDVLMLETLESELVVVVVIEAEVEAEDELVVVTFCKKSRSQNL